MPIKHSVKAIMGAALLAGIVGCDSETTGPDYQGGSPPTRTSRQWVAQVVGDLPGFDRGAQGQLSNGTVRAELFADGTAGGTLQDLGHFRASVACLRVEGSRAWIGATVTDGELDIDMPSDGGITPLDEVSAMFYFIDNDDGTVDVQIEHTVDPTFCGAKDEPDLPFFTINGNFRIVDRR